jgi:hypothetical protein
MFSQNQKVDAIVETGVKTMDHGGELRFVMFTGEGHVISRGEGSTSNWWVSGHVVERDNNSQLRSIKECKGVCGYMQAAYGYWMLEYLW